MKPKNQHQITRTAPAVPVVVPSPPTAITRSFDSALERLLLLLDGTVEQAEAAVQAGNVDEAQRLLDQASAGLRMARRVGADTTAREETLAKLRNVVDEIGRLTA